MALLNGNKRSILIPDFLKMDFLKKFKELLIDATIGLVKQYQTKTLGLVKIEAAAFYVRLMQLLHRQVLILVLVLFLAALAAVSIVVVPLALLMLIPLAKEVRLALVLLLGIADIGVPLYLLSRFLSEKKWLELTKSQELIDNAIKNG